MLSSACLDVALQMEDALAPSVPLVVGVAVYCAIASRIVKIKDDFREMGVPFARAQFQEFLGALLETDNTVVEAADTVSHARD